MHGFEEAGPAKPDDPHRQPALVQAADPVSLVRADRGGLGWLFDTMDQQLFNLARTPAMTELLGPSRVRRRDRRLRRLMPRRSS